MRCRAGLPLFESLVVVREHSGCPIPAREREVEALELRLVASGILGGLSSVSDSGARSRRLGLWLELRCRAATERPILCGCWVIWSDALEGIVAGAAAAALAPAAC